MSTTPLIEITDLKNILGGQSIHDGLNLSIDQKEIVSIIGSSGSGKTTLLRSILMLQKPDGGAIKIFETDITQASLNETNAIRRRFGVLFQQNALFGALTVLENVQFPLRTFTKLPDEVQVQIALLKIALVGLPVSASSKYPSELSGGMQKRAALARAIALDPELLFLDEPTAGLDPQSAASFDELVLNLRDNLGLTIMMITHDLDTLAYVSDRVAFLGDKKVLAALPLPQLMKDPHPQIQEYFSGHRAEKYKEIQPANQQTPQPKEPISSKIETI